MSKILIIDDEPAICESMQESLEFEGYEVQTATDPRKGQQMAIDNHFDLIISDVKMPGIDGIDLIHNLREQGIDSTICMMSAHGNVETAVKAIAVVKYFLDYKILRHLINIDEFLPRAITLILIVDACSDFCKLSSEPILLRQGKGIRRMKRDV